MNIMLNNFFYKIIYTTLTYNILFSVGKIYSYKYFFFIKLFTLLLKNCYTYSFYHGDNNLNEENI